MQIFFLPWTFREAAKKILVNCRAIKREGGGGKGPAIKEKNNFLLTIKFNVQAAIKLEGEGIRP